ncbi:MAG: tagaturonate reductase [Acetobacter sp.]|nr:tagaturonate reductase [Bacteroides sp.]MCM1342037.1 tagaturonate reductase [Acetobacter sp.]MCM1434235.1 tagaturonate reductase [Clostridiales bacterium]
MMQILQIGEGNFLRAFAEYYLELAKNNNTFDGSVTICQPRNNTKTINMLKEQDYKYNILLKGRKNNRIVDETVMIDCVSSCIDTVGEYDKLVKLFKSSNLEIVISNTTEAGICFNAEDKIENSPNVSFPAKVTALLYERYIENSSPLIFLPVELIDNNGDELKKCIIKYAKLWALPDAFTEYINSCHFCNTLVDRIVTGHTEYENDCCAVACEPYGSWIISADDTAKKKLSALFNKIDDITYSDNLSAYRNRKVRILNGAHTMSVLAGYNMGFNIVRDMLKDDTINSFIRKGLYDEIIPTINMPEDVLRAFADSVLERFDNPFIDHKLFDISLNSVSKFKARCLGSIIDYINIFNKAPSALSFAFAEMINFYYNRNGYTPNDSESVTSFFSDKHFDIVSDTLSNADFWDMDLTQVDYLYNEVKKYYDKIVNLGVRKAMEGVCNE